MYLPRIKAVRGVGKGVKIGSTGVPSSTMTLNVKVDPSPSLETAVQVPPRSWARERLGRNGRGKPMQPGDSSCDTHEMASPRPEPSCLRVMPDSI